MAGAVSCPYRLVRSLGCATSSSAWETPFVESTRFHFAASSGIGCEPLGRLEEVQEFQFDASSNDG